MDGRTDGRRMDRKIDGKRERENLDEWSELYPVGRWWLTEGLCRKCDRYYLI